jgi:hypothetical protein
MPHQVYSLMTTHRSHRIQIPDAEQRRHRQAARVQPVPPDNRSVDARATAQWPNSKRTANVKLSAEEESMSAAVLTLARRHAAGGRRRGVLEPCRRTASEQTVRAVLTRLLEGERYPAVRYLAHRGLRDAHGKESEPFDYLARPAEREAQLRALRDRFDATPIRRLLPQLPLTPQGLPDQAVLDRLRVNRHDPDLTINE